MKKIISLMLVLLLCGSLTVFATMTTGSAPAQLIDEADLLTDRQEAELLAKLEEISQAYGAQVSIVTLSSLEGMDIDTAVNTIYDQGGYGYGSNYDGVLLLISMDVREYRILSNGFAGDAITTSDIDSISDWIVSDLSAGNYADAFHTFIDECDYYLNGYINGYPFDPAGTLMFAVPVGLVVALIVVLIFKGQLKSVRRNNYASAYVRPGSMQITQANDIYLYRHVSRTERQESSSSGSSGSSSSRSVGGGKF